ncbi:AhpC/TSA family protein [Balneicella halophila]|uniref:AhpC/TSA family protein n=1 Tax=Balneicella halophila TaxID=1537566 RepID=A0A7L4URU8_BALHA|nr:redoxin domain-containing protein [Balneicella halophila]PVX52379.1 AhpC/TSA family protein [Balneicella halophila]
MKLIIKIAGILIISFLITQCKKEQNAQNQNTVNAEIKGLKNGDLVVFALGSYNDRQEKIDSVLYDGSSDDFTFQTQGKDVAATIYVVPEGEVYNIKDKNKLYFFLEGYSTIDIEADANSLMYAEISGGIYDKPELKEIKKYQEKTWELEKQAKSMLNETQQEGWDNTKNADVLRRADNIMKKADTIQSSEVSRLEREFVNNNPDIAYSAELLYGDTYFKENATADEFERVFMNLSERVRRTRVGKTVYELMLAKKLTQLGEQAPSFNVKTVKNTKVSLDDLRGKYALICFWETWEDCMLFGLNLKGKKLRSKVDNNKLAVLNIIASDQGYYDYRAPKIGPNWMFSIDLDRSVFRTYGVLHSRTYFLLDSNGMIFMKGELNNESIEAINKEVY